MNYHSKTTRLKEIFLSDLAGERFGEEGRIPSALHLSRLYAASRNTIRRMLGELEAEGILRRESNHRLQAAGIPVRNHAAGLPEEPPPTEGKRPVLGWFYSGSCDQLIVARTRGIERFAEEHNLGLRIFTSLHGHEPVLGLLDHIQGCGVDGVLVANHPLPRYTETLNRLTETGFPVVVACGQAPNCHASIVAEDDFHGIYAATSHLLEMYRNPIYFLGGAGNIEIRLRGFRQAMCDAGFIRESEKHIHILKQEMDALQNGETLELLAPLSFEPDLENWLKSTGHQALSKETGGDFLKAVLRKVSGENSVSGTAALSGGHSAAIVLFSNDLDKAMAALIIACGMAASGAKVGIFFTFWGLSVLRRDPAPMVRKNLISRLFGWMLPKGATHLKLSKMNMGGIGTAMMNQVMDAQNVTSLPELLTQAKALGVRFIACEMAMGVMGISREELIEVDEVAGVASFVELAKHSSNTLFI